MKHILNKKGVTVLEGLIALALLAMVAVGTFGVLLSSSRKSSTPDLREDMLYSIERAHRALQTFSPSMEGNVVDDPFLEEMRVDPREGREGHFYSIHFYAGENHPAEFWDILDDGSRRNGFSPATLCGPSELNCIGRAKNINSVGMLSVLCSPNAGANAFTYTVNEYENTSEGPTLAKMIDRYSGAGLEEAFQSLPRGYKLLRRIDFRVVCQGATL